MTMVEIGRGVYGHSVDVDEYGPMTYIEIMWCEGDGLHPIEDYVDSLPNDRIWKIYGDRLRPEVVEILKARGWDTIHEFDDRNNGEVVTVYALWRNTRRFSPKEKCPFPEHVTKHYIDEHNHEVFEFDPPIGQGEISKIEYPINS